MSINIRSAPSRRYHCTTVTDLDQPEAENASKKTQVIVKKRSKEKLLNTLSGNFNCRTQSVECVAENGVEDATGLQKNTKVTSCLSELLQSKNDKMNELVQRLGTLHKFNEQFAKENEMLVNNMKSMEEHIELLQHKLDDCEKCRRLEMDLTKKDNEIKSLTADVEMMKTLTYRLNVQIERYQDILREKHLPNSDTNKLNSPFNQIESSLSQWPDGTIRAHTLAPLLQAYDEMLHDKTQLVQQYSQQFEQFTGELKQIVKENNSLQEQMETLKQEYGNWREERARLQAQANVSYQKAEAQTKKTDLAKEKLVEVMHCYEQKIQTLILDMEHLQSAYARCKHELASIKSLSKLPQESITQSLQECKNLLERLRKEHDVEKSQLERSIESYKERCTTMHRQIEHFQMEHSALQKKLNEMNSSNEEIRNRNVSLNNECEKLKRSRRSLKTRLRIALQWAHKLEENQNHLQEAFDSLKRFDTVVKYKESQVRGLQARHFEEVDKLEQKLALKEETIRNILRDKLNINTMESPDI